jgi:hypothetical protein
MADSKKEWSKFEWKMLSWFKWRFKNVKNQFNLNFAFDAISKYGHYDTEKKNFGHYSFCCINIGVVEVLFPSTYNSLSAENPLITLRNWFYFNKIIGGLISFLITNIARLKFLKPFGCDWAVENSGVNQTIGSSEPPGLFVDSCISSQTNLIEFQC